MAAGTGSRFGHYTAHRPKGLVDVCGTPMILQSIEHLLASGIDRIVLGTGYCARQYERIAMEYPGIECVLNEKYAVTNSMYTLYSCRNTIDSAFLLLESDLVYEKRVINELLEHPAENVMLAASLSHTWDEYFIETDSHGMLFDLSPDKSALTAVHGELVGIHKISLEFFKTMCDIAGRVLTVNPCIGYEYVIRDAARKIPCAVHKIPDLLWHEIDDERDLRFAEETICPRLNGMR